MATILSPAHTHHTHAHTHARTHTHTHTPRTHTHTHTHTHARPGVITDGSEYNLAPGLVFSLPVVTTRGGGVTVVRDLTLDADAAARLAASEEELLAERRLAGVEGSAPR